MIYQVERKTLAYECRPVIYHLIVSVTYTTNTNNHKRYKKCDQYNKRMRNWTFSLDRVTFSIVSDIYLNGGAQRGAQGNTFFISINLCTRMCYRAVLLS